MSEPLFISSRDNPLIKALKKLGSDSTEYRKQQRIWVEGDHLLRAAVVRGVRPALGVFSESFWPVAKVQSSQEAIKNIVLTDALFDSITALESPARMGFVFDLPVEVPFQPGQASVVLDRLQDAGNVGAILRSASAFGFSQVIAMRGTAALWSPKVLRAGMGAHWGLALLEGADLSLLDNLALPLMVTSSHRGDYLHRLLSRRELAMPVFGPSAPKGRASARSWRRAPRCGCALPNPAEKSRSTLRPPPRFVYMPAPLPHWPSLLTGVVLGRVWLDPRL